MWDSAVASSPLQQDLGSEQAAYYMEECTALGSHPTGCYTTGAQTEHCQNVPEARMSANVLCECMTADNMDSN